MNIQAATTVALEIGGYMSRSSWDRYLMVQPTNLRDCCLLHAKGLVPGPRWNPKAEDLTASDWEVFPNLDELGPSPQEGGD